MSLTPVKRRTASVRRAGINSCNDQTRQAGDSRVEALRRHRVRRRFSAAPAAGEGDDHVGTEDHRPDGSPGRDLQSHARKASSTGGGSAARCIKRTAFAGATTGQQLLYALDEQVRRWEVGGQDHQVRVLGFSGPDAGRARRMPRLRRTGPGDDADPRLSGRCGGHRQRRLRPDLRPLDQLHGLHRQCRQPLLPAGREVRQRRVHPGTSDGHSRRGQAASDERIGPRAKADACGCRARRRTPRNPREIPDAERYYFLEERYPHYGNLVPRDIATREIFDICVNEGLSVEQDRQCVYLDLTHIPRTSWTASWAASWRSTRSSRASTRGTCP